MGPPPSDKDHGGAAGSGPADKTQASAVAAAKPDAQEAPPAEINGEKTAETQADPTSKGSEVSSSTEAGVEEVESAAAT